MLVIVNFLTPGLPSRITPSTRLAEVICAGFQGKGSVDVKMRRT
jgi:hypothetical protein